MTCFIPKPPAALRLTSWGATLEGRLESVTVADGCELIEARKVCAIPEEASSWEASRAANSAFLSLPWTCALTFGKSSFAMLWKAIARNWETCSDAVALRALHCAIEMAFSTLNLGSPTLKDSSAHLAADAARAEIWRHYCDQSETIHDKKSTKMTSPFASLHPQNCAKQRGTKQVWWVHL